MNPLLIMLFKRRLGVILYPILFEVIKEQITFLRSAWLMQVLLSVHNTSPQSAFRGIDRKMDGGTSGSEEDNRGDGKNDAERRIK